MVTPLWAEVLALHLARVHTEGESLAAPTERQAEGLSPTRWERGA